MRCAKGVGFVFWALELVRETKSNGVVGGFFVVVYKKEEKKYIPPPTRPPHAAVIFGGGGGVVVGAFRRIKQLKQTHR